MKHTTRITASLLLILMLMSTLLPMSVDANGTTLTYSTTSNSGTRHEVCTTLEGTAAASYYTGDYTYGTLSVLESDALFDELNELMTDTHNRVSTYANCRDMAVKTDCEANDGRINLIYTSYSATRAQYINDGGVWNREHVWPKSLGGFDQEGPGGDLHHIRPSDETANAKRGNLLYGNAEGGSNVLASSHIGPSFVCGTKKSGYFEPLDNVKGDVARICLYVYVRYGKDAGYPKCASITNVFQSVDVLLEWCALDPVDTWEMGRNEVVGAFQGNRNVFIDYPEYAWLLFDKEIPESMTTPSGQASDPTPDCTHANTELRNKRVENCGKSGYTGDTYCTDCDALLSRGRGVVATGKHTFEDGKDKNGNPIEICTVCSFKREKPAPTVDPVMIIIAASAVVLVGGGATAAVIVVKKKKKNI